MTSIEEYEEALEAGPFFTEVERGTGKTQLEWDEYVRAGWEDRMLTQAQLLGMPDPPFADRVKERRMERMQGAQRAREQLEASKVNDKGVNPEDLSAGSIVSLLAAAAVVLIGCIMFTAGKCSSDDEPEKTAEENLVEHTKKTLRLAAIRWVRKNIADPDAEILDTKADYSMEVAEAIVVVTVRARNAFGGYVVESFELLVNRRSGKVLESRRL